MKDIKRLFRAFPGAPSGGITPYILADKVSYADFAPWPMAADGAGSSLQRISRSVIGNDPSNWLATPPTTGKVNYGQSPILDNDGDGIPNLWEISYGLDPFSAADALLDPDGDGQSSAHEYLAQTNPLLRSDVLSITVAKGPPREIQFTAKSAVSYTLEYSTDLVFWHRLEEIPIGVERQINVLDPSTDPRRYYRLVTPQRP